MQKPTIKEIQAYIEEKNYNLDAEAFFFHYEQKGWMVGKTPMKQWKSAVSLWAVNGWGKTAKSQKDYDKRVRQPQNRAYTRELYGDYLRSASIPKLIDLRKDPGQVPVWLIDEILAEAGVTI